jgi:hypothetical protein
MMPSPILLIAPESSATPVVAALRRSLDAEVDVASGRRAGLACLRRREYALVLLEESLTAADPEAADLIYQNAAGAPLLEVNFVIAGPERILRQCRATLQRRASDRAAAESAATHHLHCELNATLTGLLLESQLALRAASPALEPKLRHVVSLASDLRDRLRSPSAA